jgi:hypothetical protein
VKDVALNGQRKKKIQKFVQNVNPQVGTKQRSKEENKKKIA